MFAAQKMPLSAEEDSGILTRRWVCSGRYLY